MGQAWSDTFTNALCLLVILGVVRDQGVQDEHLAPFRALVEGREELVDRLGVQVGESGGGG